MKTIVLTFCVLFSSALYSQLNIIPQPAEMNLGKGTHSFKTPLQIVYDEPAKRSAEFLADYLKRFYNVNSKLTPSSGPGRDAYYIMLITGVAGRKGEYELKIDKHLSISGDEEGVFYGVQTFIQMLPPHVSNNPVELPYVTIKDYPRFGYRGMHLDCGRNFMSIDFVKKYIDYLAFHKMNYFHWHLTEDQGWRIEIKKYPRLTEVGAWRNGTMIGRYADHNFDSIRYGGYYTQDDIREIVKYAQSRHITVVPEIEMPGHALAALASY